MADTIKDSGNRREFSTGAVRDMQEGKGRLDLVPLNVVSVLLDDAILSFLSDFKESGYTNTSDLYCVLKGYAQAAFNGDMYTMILEVAKHFENGAKKYGENNWQKGLPPSCYIDSATRHYLKHKRGDDDEPHHLAVVWNILCCIWEVDYHDCNN